MKNKETLEEVAERLYPTDYGVKSKDIINIIKQDTFIKGAKWQQEQDKNKYSEEEVKKITEQTIEKFYKHIYADKTKAEMKELWFEQIKKK
jgi:hypothetical protein